MKNRSNQMIETMRCISCLIVLLIHLNLSNSLGILVDRYGRFAVLFFLLVSGYYSYSNSFSESAKKKLRQILLLVLIHGTVCIIWNSINSYLRSGSLVNWLYPYLSFATLKRLLLYNRATFINSAFYHFFMLMYIYAICIVLGKQNSRIMSYIYALSFALYIIGYCMLHFTMHVWYHVGNFLFTGIPVFFFGHLIHRFSIHRKISKWSIPLLIFSILLTHLETTFLHGTYTTIGQLLFAILLLTICINNPQKQLSILAVIGSECSLYIMMYHCQIRDTIGLFIQKDMWFFPFAVILSSLFLSIIFAKVKQMIFLTTIKNTD